MADDTDALFGLILFILFLALLGYAAGGGGSSATTTAPRPTATYVAPTTTVTPGATDKGESNIPGGPVEPCQGKMVANKTAHSANGSVNLKVYYTEDNDRNCIVVTRSGWPNRTQGRLEGRLRFSDYGGNQWPEYAYAWSQPHTTSLGGIYIDDTYNRCITATGSFTPYTGMDKVTVKVGPTGCN
jgi:hypothetical protein